MQMKRSCRMSVSLCVVFGAAAACASCAAAEPAAGSEKFWIRQDGDVLHVEPAPHDGSGQTKAYRYFDDVPNPGVVFRKRALPKGGAIGMHVLEHDEVYYLASGRAELVVDDEKRALSPNTAVYMRRGANVGIRQDGDEEAMIIVAYPPTR